MEETDALPHQHTSNKETHQKNANAHGGCQERFNSKVAEDDRQPRTKEEKFGDGNCCLGSNNGYDTDISSHTGKAKKVNFHQFPRLRNRRSHKLNCLGRNSTPQDFDESNRTTLLWESQPPSQSFEDSDQGMRHQHQRQSPSYPQEHAADTVRADSPHQDCKQPKAADHEHT